jgi:hypothetical protein
VTQGDKALSLHGRARSGERGIQSLAGPELEKLPRGANPRALSQRRQTADISDDNTTCSNYRLANNQVLSEATLQGGHPARPADQAVGLSTRELEWGPFVLENCQGHREQLLAGPDQALVSRGRGRGPNTPHG